MSRLRSVIGKRLAVTVKPEIAAAARAICDRLGGVAVLFYGSVLRTGDLDGVLDFYVLRPDSSDATILSRWLWPDVSYHEVPVGDAIIRAKVATMPLRVFERATAGEFLDTTIWARFVQPTGLVWAADAIVRERVVDAISTAAVTAARFATALGPAQGAAHDYWASLFRATYAVELRVERSGRETQILSFDTEHFDALLPLAWDTDGIEYRRTGETLIPHLTSPARGALIKAWETRRRMGKPLNVARLIKAAFTFEGATRYALWKIERHTGVALTVTPWRERHPILAAPGVLWRVWRTAGAR